MTPPSSPPPVPPVYSQSQPPAPKKKGLHGCVIALICVGVALPVLAILASLAVPAYNAIQAKARQIKAEREAKAPTTEITPSAPLSEEEKKALEAFMEKLIAAIEESDQEALNRMVDYDTFTAGVFEGLSSDASVRAGFQKGIKQKPGGIYSNVLGQPGRFLRHRVRNGMPAATLRFLLEAGGASYLDIIVRRDDRGGFLVVNTYDYLFGADVLQEARRAVALMMGGGADQSLLARLFGIQGAFDKKRVDQITGVRGAVTSGDFALAASRYEALPENLRRMPFLYSAYVQALQQLGDSEEANAKYLAALEQGRSILGPDVMIDMLYIDLHFMKNDFAAARDAVKASLRVIGDDAYLHHLLGLMCVKLRDAVGAEQALQQAQKIEPDLSSLIDLKLQVLALKEDHVGLARLLREFAKETGAELAPDILSEPVYEAFKQSPEFKSWAAEVAKQ
jgi:Flp pilus assembly protein TadD